MIKTITLAVVFSASTLVAVPTASASPLVCSEQYQEDLEACNGNATCEVAADIKFLECLRQQAASIE